VKRYFSLLKPYLLDCILAPALKMGEGALELIVPLILADIIDHGILPQNHHYIQHMSLDLVWHGLYALVLSLGALFFATRASLGFTASLKRMLFSHIQTLSNPDLDRIGKATLIARLSDDTERIQSGLNLSLRTLLRVPFVVIGAFVMAYTIDPAISLIFLAVIPPLLLTVFLLLRLSSPLYTGTREQSDRLLSHLRENLSGARVLRSFSRQKEEERVFDGDNDRLTVLQGRLSRLSALLHPITFVLINLAILALFYFGAIEVDGGAMTQGRLVALYNYLALILSEVLRLSRLLLSLTRTSSCMRRVNSLMNAEPSIIGAETDPEEDPSAPAVEFRHVSLNYSRSAHRALSDLSFSIPRGATVGILGGTGSGKSSLGNLINRGYDVSGGAVLVNGVDVMKYPLTTLRDKIGMVPQHPLLFRGTVRDNLLWGDPNATEEELQRALRLAQADDIPDKLEHGLDEPIVQGGRNLSGGQRLRLTIARALLSRPEILILDDSSSSLDPAAALGLRKALAALPDRPTVLLFSQSTAAIRHADWILVLEEGRLVASGNHESLLHSCALYREFHTMPGNDEEVTA